MPQINCPVCSHKMLKMGFSPKNEIWNVELPPQFGNSKGTITDKFDTYGCSECGNFQIFKSRYVENFLEK